MQNHFRSKGSFYVVMCKIPSLQKKLNHFGNPSFQHVVTWFEYLHHWDNDHWTISMNSAQEFLISIVPLYTNSFYSYSTYPYGPSAFFYSTISSFWISRARRGGIFISSCNVDNVDIVWVSDLLEFEPKEEFFDMEGSTIGFIGNGEILREILLAFDCRGVPPVSTLIIVFWYSEVLFDGGIWGMSLSKSEIPVTTRWWYFCEARLGISLSILGEATAL